ncbi:MAG: hypothetical protein ACKO96_44260, partial [Flammeovirgaceae bacterium]
IHLHLKLFTLEILAKNRQSISNSKRVFNHWLCLIRSAFLILVSILSLNLPFRTEILAGKSSVTLFTN